MKSRIVKSIYGVALVSVLTLVGTNLLTQTRGAHAQNQEAQARKLEGTWRVEITQIICDTGGFIRTFPALVTFARGGTLNAPAAGSSPARVSPDYGTWQHTGGHTYSAVSEALLFSPTGDWFGTQRVTRAIEIGDDPEVLTANTSIEILDVGGHQVATGCATAVAHRLE